MPLISLICFSTFIILLLTGLKKNTDFLSPGRIFGMLWAFVLGVVELKWSRLQVEWSLFDWVIVLIALTTFFIGIYISYIINLDKPFLSIREIRKSLRQSFIDEGRLFKFIVIYFLVCLASFIIEWKIEGYIPLFTSNPDKARVMFGIFGLNYVLNSINAVMFLVIQYFIFVKGNYSKKAFLVLIFIISLGNYVLFVQRFGMFILLMLGFALYYYAGKKIRIRTIIIFAVLIISLLAGIQSIRATQFYSTYVYLGSKMKFSSQYSDLTIPYMYVAMNVENFVKYYSHIEKHSFGFFTFEYLIELSTIRKWFIDYYHFDKYKLHISGYNTFPFFWTYYLDYGIAGLALMPFIIGFIISEIYYYFHRNPTLVMLAMVSIVFAVIMISFNSDALSRLDTVLPFTVIVLAQFLFIKKARSSKNESVK